MSDPTRLEEELDRLCASQYIDIISLTENAGRHFEPRQSVSGTFSPAELDALATAELEYFLSPREDA